MTQHKRRGFLQDLRSLYLSIEESTGGQAVIGSSSDFTVIVLITPSEGANAHATFTVEIRVEPGYPKSSPKVIFCTPIFHPNISNEYGDVCLSMLDNWNSCYSLLDLVKALIFLINNPNFDSSNNSFGFLSESLRQSVTEVTHQLLAGYPVRGRFFQPNKSWCTWANTNGCFPSPLFEKTSKTSPVENLENVEPEVVEDVYIEAVNENAALSDGENIRRTYSCDVTSMYSTSTYIPSVANVRYSIGSVESSFGSRFRPCHYSFFKPCRILVTVPEKPIDQLPQVFYYCEYVGLICAQKDLGNQYFRLFSGSVLQDIQSTYRQTSSILPWYQYSTDFRYTDYKYTYVPSVCLSDLSCLFCEHSNSISKTEIFPECGFHLLNRLFAERAPKNSTDELSSLNLNDLFSHTDLSDRYHSSSISEVSYEAVEYADTDAVQSTHIPSSRSSVSEIPSEENSIPESENQLFTKPQDEERQNRFHCCYDCSYSYSFYARQLNDFLPSNWIYSQTRWPPTLAPYHIIDLSLNSETRIPPWRASVNRLAFDLRQFAQRYPSTELILLLDPMAISPWSPIANLLTVNKKSSETRENWFSLMWLTPAMAISSTTCIDKSIFPSSFGLRLLSTTALLSNWLAWFSRIETYSSVGYSRIAFTCIANPVVTTILSPANLGCGQAPILDLWPLWSARLLIKSFCKFYTFFLNRMINSQEKFIEIRSFFPFSDVDEL